MTLLFNDATFAKNVGRPTANQLSDLPECTLKSGRDFRRSVSATCDTLINKKVSGSTGEEENRECASKTRRRAQQSRLRSHKAPAAGFAVARFLSRARLAGLKQCGPRENKEINTRRQRSAV